jgi:starch synthase
MKVLFLAAEATPFVKVGGLADVAGELPRALTTLGVDVRLCLPFYPSIRKAGFETRPILDLSVRRRDGEIPASVHQLERQGLCVDFIDSEPVRSDTSIYGNTRQEGKKFTLTSLAALQTCRALDWKPDIVHANDWHTAAAIVWLIRNRERDSFWQDAIGIFSIHNLAYMGAGTENVLTDFGLPPVEDSRLPDWSRHTPLAMALSQADWLSTVSPSYAGEIQTPEFGYGLETLLRARRKRLVGIVNGIDTQVWNPALDEALPVNFSAEDLAPRSEVKRALQEQLGLAADEAVPLLGMVTRLDQQKGVDLALEALELLGEESWQFVLLGTGAEAYERQAQDFAQAFSERVRVVLRFDAPLARRIYAGSDALLVPSRYEPCGLTQLIAMRYGCVPVVRETGGLKDTVTPYGRDRGTGFLFKSADAQSLAAVVREALGVYRDSTKWKRLQLRCMVQDHSWQITARQYLQLYERAAADRSHA